MRLNLGGGGFLNFRCKAGIPFEKKGEDKRKKKHIKEIRPFRTDATHESLTCNLESETYSAEETPRLPIWERKKEEKKEREREGKKEAPLILANSVP